MIGDCRRCTVFVSVASLKGFGTFTWCVSGLSCQRRVVLHDGTRGLVVKSGHGFYTVEMDNDGGKQLKRICDLRLEREVDGRSSGTGDRVLANHRRRHSLAHTLCCACLCRAGCSRACRGLSLFPACLRRRAHLVVSPYFASSVGPYHNLQTRSRSSRRAGTPTTPPSRLRRR